MRRAAAELMGTYALVVCGCGAAMVNTRSGGELGPLGVALAFGFVVLVMIAALGHVSGAHFNPAVTIAFAVTRHIRAWDVLAYVVAQVSGAVLAALTLRGLIGEMGQLGATVPSVALAQAFGLEVLLTALLMFVIISVATDTRAVGAPAALAIGFTVALNALWAGPLTGASMNPARSLGPGIVAGVWDGQWIYWVAPMVGACVGALLYQWVRQPEG